MDPRNVLSAILRYTTFHSIDGVGFKSLSRPFQITVNLVISKNYTLFICREILYIYEKYMSLKIHISVYPMNIVYRI